MVHGMQKTCVWIHWPLARPVAPSLRKDSWRSLSWFHRMIKNDLFFQPVKSTSALFLNLTSIQKLNAPVGQKKTERKWRWFIYYLGVLAMDDSLYSHRGRRLLNLAWNRFRCRPCCCLNYTFFVNSKSFRQSLTTDVKKTTTRLPAKSKIDEE